MGQQQIIEKSPQTIQKNAKYGGTGAVGGPSEDEDECIATFSSDEDDNNEHQSKSQLTLS